MPLQPKISAQNKHRIKREKNKEDLAFNDWVQHALMTAMYRHSLQIRLARHLSNNKSDPSNNPTFLVQNKCTIFLSLV